MPGSFPTLNTAAIAQYPLTRSAAIPVESHTFLDFTRQAYRDASTAKKTWKIALNLLDAGEIARLKAFFQLQQGQFGTFTFVDPWDGSSHPNCSFAEDTFTHQQQGETHNQLHLTVYEHA